TASSSPGVGPRLLEDPRDPPLRRDVETSRPDPEPIPVAAPFGSQLARNPPPERIAFFEFQARNRRATWQLGAVCALVAGGGGALSALVFVANLLLVLFALVFIPSVLAFGLGALAMLSPVTPSSASPCGTWRAS